MRYSENLDFLPFGRLSDAERRNLQQSPTPWREKIRQLQDAGRYRWILLDVPAGDDAPARQALDAADRAFVLLTPDANCHARLHQQPLPEHGHFLINHYNPHSQLQQDLHQLWLQSLHNLLPVMVHRDEALAEAPAMKQPLGEYRPESLAADEILTLANWCLLHLQDSAA